MSKWFWNIHSFSLTSILYRAKNTKDNERITFFSILDQSESRWAWSKDSLADRLETHLIVWDFGTLGDLMESQLSVVGRTGKSHLERDILWCLNILEWKAIWILPTFKSVMRKQILVFLRQTSNRHAFEVNDCVPACYGYSATIWIWFDWEQL